ncbi:hypothetical protein [Aeromonas veronii]|uniref:hypothetical protein n=1 Tax=Aeromonas veronii TaxID=654 RepID=UPI003D1A3760
MKSFLQRNLGFPLKVGGVLGGSVGFIGDVLQPIAPFGFYISALCVAALMMSLLLLISPVNSYLSDRLSDYWYTPLASTLIIFSLLSYGANYYSEAHGDGHGVLAENIPFIDRLQKELGLIQTTLNDISENTKNTAANTAKIADNTAEISKEVKKVKSVLDGVKKETSDDPRKELSNMGINWSRESLYDAVQSGDIKALTLFLSGGMNSEDAYHSFDGYAFSDYFRGGDLNEIKSVYLLFKNKNAMDLGRFGGYQQAIFGGHIDLVNLFMENGEELDAEYSGDLNMIGPNFNKVTPACMARFMTWLSSVDSSYGNKASEYKKIEKLFKRKGAKVSGFVHWSVGYMYHRNFDCNA